MNISNKTLALFVVAAMVLSVVSTFTLLSKLGEYQPLQEVTAKATTDQGNVTFEVVSTLSIVLNPDTVDFGTGRINLSCPAPGAVNNATLTAGPTYNDTEGTNCWTDDTATDTWLLLENDGNLNASIQVFGPDETTFFNNYAGSQPYNLTLQAGQGEANSCIPGGLLNSSWMTFGNLNRTLCSNLRYFPEGSDQLGISVKVIIPADLGTGIYENSSIVFTAVQS